MYRSIKSDKDSYITDRIIRGIRQNNANVGAGGTLDIFKIYGLNTTGTVALSELSRLLIHFDLTDLRTDYANGVFNIASPTFKCNLKLHDVYGGQTTPQNFTIRVYPLSRSWVEGRGKDVVFYQDQDNVNFLTTSFSGGTASTWYASGANGKGLLGSSNIDIISSGSLGAGIVTLSTSQSFVNGVEDLSVDITRIISATLANQLPDYGFRISLDETQEDDNKTYFVKRFGSRNSIDPNIQPELIVRYDDSRISHQSYFHFDDSGTIFMSKYIRGSHTNVVSGSTRTPITGSNCMLMKLWTYYSSSTGYQQYSQYATASQHSVGSYYITGVYSATFVVPSTNSNLLKLISNAALSGTNTPVTFNQVWTSFDETVAYHSATLAVHPANTTVINFRSRRYQVNIPNVNDEYASNDVVKLRAFIFDRLNPFFKFVKVPQVEPSVNIESYYSIRDVQADQTIVPFDRTYGSTRLSSDGEHLYFNVWMDCLIPNRTYAIDIMLIDGNDQEIYYDASPAFRVVPTSQ